MEWPEHGGQPESVRQQLAPAAETVYDFSANLNPLGPPAWLHSAVHAELSSINVYPEPSYEAARQALAEMMGVKLEEVLLTNGGAEAIFLAARLFAGGSALIVQPTFSEYEQACRHYGVGVRHINMKEFDSWSLPLTEIRAHIIETDVVFLCRPNNPTGTLAAQSEMMELLIAAEASETTVVVDEAFIDFLSESDSLVSWIYTHPSLIVLRSLTKVFTVPGLRIGGVAAAPVMIEKLAAGQMPWSVNALASKITPALCADEAFLGRTKAWLQAELPRMKRELEALHFNVSPSVVNFYLLQDKLAPQGTDELLTFLFQSGIAARHTHTFPGLNGSHIRFALRSLEENDELLRVLHAWRRKQC
ncbi:L-threonine O-3-phosphate decarboxylase [Salsuginibacillus halophilus]|uniref:threonine-phosphate decarboxylase n=1 Tax=Salsuginibacillus halophilus TaxID=517424 RepID=A0A2P8HL22_9BACI|nr:threonine-phosphate decarboxylase CobD [Salsuginibacillus halophilus]PSL46918.1 L-threonine O-3-phosphate decarboxylase [Salsuginibacillus halophilus]